MSDVIPQERQMFIADGPNLDAFQRLRVSEPVTLFDSQMQYGVNATQWESVLTGSGTAAHVANEAAVRLRCGTASGDKVVRQTRNYFRYQPGKSQLVLMTGVVGAAKANVRKRVGYFDGSNGVFLEQTSTGVYWVRRTNVSGTPTDTRVLQSSWNITPLDGNDPNDATLDFSKSQILVMDFEWLGVGRVRCGFVLDGQIVYTHQFLNTNSLSTVYMTTANLPLRYEIENTAEAASNTDLYQICASVISEGGFEEGRGLPFAYGLSTGVSTTARVPLLSIRPAATLNSIVNRGAILPSSVEVMSLTKGAVIEVVYGGTLTGASWTAVDATYSLTERDVAASAISGGIVTQRFYVPASSNGAARTPGAARVNLLSRLPLTLNSAGSHPTVAGGAPFTDSLSIVATSENGSDAAVIHAAFNWQELY